MTNPISSVPLSRGLEQLRPPDQAGKTGEFQDLLQNTIQKLESANGEASNAIQKFLTGENQELHSTALAVQKAEIAFDLGLQVRNKVVSAYQEIMRMQM
jgi:flagellar hook-basal body complex protein FliE